MKRIDLTKKRFGRLFVLSPTTLNSYNQLRWICKCDCGNFIEVIGVSLRNGDTKSCGCLKKDLMREKKTIHGAYKNRTQRERLYTIWAGMKSRCYNKNESAYKYYGQRGIKITTDWLHDYTSFRDWALSNGYAENLTIERINNDGNYEPDNCCFIPFTEQAKNRRQKIVERDPVTGRFIKSERVIKNG